MKNFISKKLLFFKLIIISKLILHLQSIECNKSYPILKNNECVSTYCNEIQFKEGECVINNPIVKTAWLTYIIIFENTNGEIDFSWDDHYKKKIMLRTIYSNNIERSYYGMEYLGSQQYIFYDEDENPLPCIKKNINPLVANGITNSQSRFFGNGNKYSYLISIGNENSNIELTDLNNYQSDLIIISPEYFLNSTNRIIKGKSSFIGNEVDPYLIYGSIISEIDNPSKNYFALFIYDIPYTPPNMFRFFNSTYLDLVKGEIISCFFLDKTSGNLSCIYLNEAYNYTIINIFNNMKNNRKNPITIYYKEEIGFLADTTNENVFFKGIFFEVNIGIYCYFSGDSNEIPTFLFKKINVNTLALTNLFSEFSVVYLKEYTFNNDFKYNDLVLSNIGENKFYFVSTDIDQKFLIITQFQNVTSSSNKKNNLLIRYYIIKLQEFYNFRILNGLKALVYNMGSLDNYLSVAIDFGYNDKYQNSQEIINNEALILFSYPNITSKTYFDFIEYAFKNNLDYFVVNFTENFLIENNIFGTKMKNFYIMDQTIEEGINYYDWRSKNKLDFVDEDSWDFYRETYEDSIKVDLTDYSLEEITIFFYIEFSLTSPINLEEYNSYCDNYNNQYGDIFDEDLFEKPKKWECYGFYYYIDIDENLIRKCDDTNCILCLRDKTYYCLVCKDDKYTIIYDENYKLGKFKKCQKEEEIIETTNIEESSNNFGTTIITELITSNSLNNFDELTNQNTIEKAILSDYELSSNEKFSEIVENTNSQIFKASTIINNEKSDNLTNYKTILITSYITNEVITSSYLKAITSTNLKTITTTNLKKIISTNLKTITSTNLKTIIPTNLKTIIPTNLRTITSTNLKTITSTNLKTITSTNLETITSTNFETITSTNFETIITTNLKTIASTNLRTITSTNLETITSTNLETITTTNLETINSTNLRTITSTNLRTITSTNLRTITSTNLRTITSTNLETIIPTNLETIASTNLKTITSTNLKTIISTNLERIASTNLKTLVSTNLKTIISTNLKTIITTNLESIETTNLEIFSDKQVLNTEISSNNNTNELSLADLFGGKYKDTELTNEQIKEIYKELKNYIINDYDGNPIIINTRNVQIQISALDDQKNEDSELSNVDLGNCEKILREKYCKTDEDELVMLKFDVTVNNEKSTYVQYELYESNSKTFLDLKECSNSDAIINVPLDLESNLESLYDILSNSGYNLFDANDSFYNDICATFSTQNGTDILLYDRRMDMYQKTLNISLCQVGCKFLSYNSETKKAECDCPIQTNEIEIDLSEIKFDSNKMVADFYETLKNSNFRVLKCYKLLYNLKVFLKNYGCMIMTVLFLLFFTLMIISKFKNSTKIKQYIKNILRNKSLSNNNDSYKKLNNSKKDNKIKKRKANKNIKESIKKDSKKENKIGKNKITKKGKKRYKSHSVIDNKLNFKLEDVPKNKVRKGSKIINNLKHAPIKRKKNTRNLNKNKISLKNGPDKGSFLSNSVQRILKGNNGNLNKNKDSIYNINGININIYNNNQIVKKKLHSSRKINNAKIEKKGDLNPIKIRATDLSGKNLNDEEMNSLSYKKALKLDKRSYFQYYISLIKKKQLILFTFIPTNDYNIIHLKIALFIVSFALYLSINAFFFNDETMHKLYKNNGIYNILSRIPQIIYSSLISATINLILKKLSLSEKNILEIKKEGNMELATQKSKDIKKCIKVKFILFFIISLILMLFFWYFISCFCAVYNNTQIILFKDTLISFALSMLYPFGLNLLPGIFRIPALRSKKKDKKCLYSFSGLLALI